MADPAAPPLGPPEGPDWLTAEPPDNSRQFVYLVTFSAVLEPGAAGLRDVAGFTREQVKTALLDALANPAAPAGPSRGRPRAAPVQAEKLVVALEQHSERDAVHYHVALKLAQKERFCHFKAALRSRAGLASHWSSTHTMFWSAVRYLTVPTNKKPAVDAEPLSWAADGKALNLYEEAQEPFNAAT